MTSNLPREQTLRIAEAIIKKENFKIEHTLIIDNNPYNALLKKEYKHKKKYCTRKIS